jgi:hypothetical protein
MIIRTIYELEHVNPADLLRKRMAAIVENYAPPPLIYFFITKKIEPFFSFFVD